MTVRRIRMKLKCDTASRFDVFCVLDGERKYQDSLCGRPLLIGEEILLIQEYAKRARREWTEDFCDGDAVEGEALNMIRKITAIGLRCMEHHGAPERLVGPQQKPVVEYRPPGEFITA